MGVLTAAATAIYVLFLYMSFDASKIIFWVGVTSLLVYAILEAIAEVSSDSAYTWKDDKRMSILRGTTMAVFAMSSCIYVINNMG